MQLHMQTHRSCKYNMCTRSSQPKFQHRRGGPTDILQLLKDLLANDSCWMRQWQFPLEILNLEATHAPVDGLMPRRTQWTQKAVQRGHMKLGRNTGRRFGRWLRG